MKTKLILTSLLLTSIACAKSDPLNDVIEILKKQAPVLKIGGYVQDEKGCLYEVKKRNDNSGIVLQSVIADKNGKVVCKI